MTNHRNRQRDEQHVWDVYRRGMAEIEQRKAEAAEHVKALNSILDDVLTMARDIAGGAHV